jgi:FeS assembly SUF system protein
MANPVRENVIVALRTIFDPEIPVNIYDLGLIYDLDIDEEGKVFVRMTLTAPACPVAETFPGTVESRLREVPGVSDVRVELVWDPPWTRERLPEEVKLRLGLL